MIRILVLIGLEFKRISRSRPSLFVVILVPIAAAAVCALAGDDVIGTVIRRYFPVAAPALGVVFFYVRGIVDRASGLSFGLASTPAGGATVFCAKLLSCILLAAAQISVFYGIVSIIG